MTDRVITLALNQLSELLRGRLVLVVVFINALFFLPRWTTSSPEAITKLVDTTQTTVGALCFFLACMAFEKDVNRRILPVVMMHPVETSVYLGGKALGLLLFFASYSFLLLAVAMGIIAYTFGSSEMSLVWLVIKNICLGSTWIAIGATLGALTASSVLAIVTIAALTVARYVAPQLAAGDWLSDFVPQAFHFLSLASSLTPSHPGSVLYDNSKRDILITLDNLFYAATVIIVGAAILARRDIPTRGE